MATPSSSGGKNDSSGLVLQKKKEVFCTSRDLDDSISAKIKLLKMISSASTHTAATDTTATVTGRGDYCDDDDDNDDSSNHADLVAASFHESFA